MTAENPTVSFGIIARARIPELDRLVNDLIERSCVPGCEIVVAVESTEVSEPVERTDDRGARWIDIPAHRGFGYNRNRVLEAVTGEILVWADDDCVPEPGWLAGLLHALEDPSIDAAAGNVRIPRSSFVGDSISALGFPAGGTAGYQTMFVVRPTGRPTT